MPKSRHTEAQMIGALQQVDAGRSAADVGREMGVSTHTIYAWKAKYGGMDVSEAQEAKQLREENARLKKMLADVMLDKDMLQSVIRKDGLELVSKRQDVKDLREQYRVSQRRACGLLRVARSSFRYEAQQDDSVLREKLMGLARERRRFGYRAYTFCCNGTANRSITKRCGGCTKRPDSA